VKKEGGKHTGQLIWTQLGTILVGKIFEYLFEGETVDEASTMIEEEN
jgi:hypothetical protein